MSSRRYPKVFLLLLILLLGYLALSTEVIVNSDPSVINVPGDYNSIQEAINNVAIGSTIFVHNGTYYERIVINKPLSIIGESPSATIIDGGGEGSVVTVTSRGVKFSGFTLRNSGGQWPSSGIRVSNVIGGSFENNILVNNFLGVLLESSAIVDVAFNTIENNRYGIYISSSTGNRIDNNNFTINWAAIVLSSSTNNYVRGNIVQNSSNVGVSISSSANNTFYYNNFLNNAYQVSIYPSGYANTWDNGYPGGGNFWSNYVSVDIFKGPYQNITGSDGIFDRPYTINADNKDQYPFVNPVLAFHDIAIENVTFSVDKVYEGQNVNVTVVVANNGNYTESFRVTLYCNETNVIGNQTIFNQGANSKESLIFSWNTTGLGAKIFVIRAEASAVTADINQSNNIFIYGEVIVHERIHDVAVEDVVPSTSKVYQGEVVSINVVVANRGNFTESFIVNVYADELLIGQKNVTNLEINNAATLIFSWNTSGVTPNREYTIKAESLPVDGELNLENNVFIDGFVRIRAFALEAVKISGLTPCDNLGNPLSSFRKGEISYFKITVNNTSTDPEIVLVTVNMYDSSTATLGVVSFKGVIMPGVSVFILGLPIPNTANTGTASVYANIFTDWPFAGGVPYGPETSGTFQILG
jgi:parallel beta-helix repeat protein